MNAQQRAALNPLLLKGVKETGNELGRGAYGVVTEVIVSGTVCAAKKLHDVIVKVKLTRYYTLLRYCLFIQEHTLRRFSEEVLLHSQQRHPNIVQLIGVHYPRGSQLPMLVMEYLPFSLTQCLEREDVEEGLPLQMKYSILLDVAKGLCYLHGKSPPIVHRDLTANNVLLTSSYTAKISDLGVSRLADTFKTHEPLTTAPGNAIVMPPEAITDKPVYNHKLDVFTYGCLIIHILTREFPVPTDAYKRQLFFLQRKVPECDRRLKYIQKIPKENEMIPLAKQCLDDDPNRRPDMIEAFQFVEQVLERYPKSNLLELIQKNKSTQKILDQFVTDIVAKENEIADLKRVLLEMSVLERLLHTKQEAFDIEIAAKESEIESNKREMSLIFKEKEANMRNLEELASELKANVIAKEDEIENCKKEIREMSLKKEANIKNLQKLVSELKANVIAKEDEIENHKKEIREMSLIIRKNEANMGNLQNLASELKANVIAKEDEIENQKKEMGEMLLKKEANIRNLQKLASELKANGIAKEDEIENHKKELKDVQSRLEKLLQEKRRQESKKTCLSRGVEALEGIQNWVCMVLLTVIGFCVYKLLKYVDYYYLQ